jgi:HEAT repeat protein
VTPTPRSPAAPWACLERIERNRSVNLAAAAVRLLVKHRAAGATEVLLRYLPSVRDEDEEGDVVYGLDELTTADGKVSPALRTALGDEAPARRAAAACVVGRRGGAEERAQVRKILEDKSPLVRLRAAQGLLAAGDKAGLPALIALLDEPAVALSWQAEELLHWAAWGTAPEEVVGGATAEERQRCRAAWEQWYGRHGAALDLSKPVAQRPPGLLLLSAGTWGTPAVPGRVLLYGCDGKPRWQLRGDVGMVAAQLLPDNRILLGEFPAHAAEGKAPCRVVERDPSGTLVWEARARWPWSCRRLANGNTFLGQRGDAGEIDAAGKPVVRYNERLVEKALGYGEYALLRNGRLGWLNDHPRRLMESDPLTGQTRRLAAFQLRANYRYEGLAVLPNGHWLLQGSRDPDREQAARSPSPGISDYDLVEFDRAGKPVWRREGWAVCCPVRLPNGNTVVSARYFLWLALVEFEPSGRKIWEDFSQGNLNRIQVCLPLVGVGFDRPLAFVDPDSVGNRLQQLKDKDPVVRERSLHLLTELGPKAEATVPAVIEALDDSNMRVRANAGEALYAIGAPAVPAVLRALDDHRLNVRAGALAAIGILNYRGAVHQDVKPIVAKVLAALQDANPVIRREAASALHGFRSEREVVVPALVQALQDADRASNPSEVSVSVIAARSLGSLGADAKSAIPGLLETIRSNDDGLRWRAFGAVGIIARADESVAAAVLPKLLKLLKDKERPGNRLLALTALDQMGAAAKPALSALRETLKASDVEDPALVKNLRMNAMSVLERLGPEAEPAVPDLIALLEDENRSLEERQGAISVLAHIGPAAKSAIPALERALKNSKIAPFHQTVRYALERIQR